MKHPRLAATAALALALAGCTDRPVPTAAAPDGPARRTGYVTSVNVWCPGSVAVGSYAYCSAYAWDSDGGYTDRTFSAQWYAGSGALNVYSFGTVQGVAAGTGWVYAVVDGVQGWTTVNVYAVQTPVPTSMSITPGSATVATGQSAGFTARVKDQNGNQMSGQSISWSSSNPSVATVNSNGYVTGVAPGSATITATSGSLSASASVSVVQGFTVSISGDAVVKPNHTCSWFAEVSGGAAPYSYSWWASPADGSSVYEPSSWTGYSWASSFTISLTVTDANGVRVSTSRQVTTSTSLPTHWDCQL